MRIIELSLAWPEAPDAPFREDFFLGAWHPEAQLKVTWATTPASIQPAVETGTHSFVLSNTSPLHPAGRALVHQVSSPQVPELLAFRGYVVEPPLHGWSEPERIVSYWGRGTFQTHNGVFAAAIIRNGSLELLTDVFGISPLYYRQLKNGVVLFATASRYLRIAGDDINPLGARMMLHRGALCGDASLTPDAARCKPGHVITFTREGKTEKPWFRFDRLPTGEKPITPATLRDAEDAFQTSVERCLRLMPDATHHLPFSSGDDSRRILVALRERKVPFHALTVRIRQKNFRDLDGRFTSDMASALGFSHEVVELVEPRDYGADDLLIRKLFSWELSEHAWMPAMFRRFRPQASLVFDGLGGDILGNTGFGEPHWHTMPESEKLARAVAEFLPDFRPPRWRDDAFVPLEQARDELRRHLELIPEGSNRTDYAFVLVRARRGTGPAMQHLTPAGYVAVYPYFDLDHIQVTMELSSMDKIEEKLQARCLRVFWPEYYQFPGSRRIPPGIPEGPPEFKIRRQLACTDQMRSECRLPALLPDARNLLHASTHMAAIASAASSTLKRKCRWWLDPVLMLLSYRNRAGFCWQS